MNIEYIKNQLQMRNEFILHTLESYMEFIELLQNDNIPDEVKVLAIQKRKDDWLPILEDMKNKLKG